MVVSTMKIRLEYLPPLRDVYGSYNDRDWEVTAAVSYYGRLNEDVIPSSSFQIYWPLNPWDELEKVEKKWLSRS